MSALLRWSYLVDVAEGLSSLGVVHAAVGVEVNKEKLRMLQGAEGGGGEGGRNKIRVSVHAQRVWVHQRACSLLRTVHTTLVTDTRVWSAETHPVLM